MVPDADLSSLTNTELVEGIQRKDYRIVDEFCRRFYRGLKYLAFKIRVDDQDADDIVQETIVTVVSQLQNGYLIRKPDAIVGFLAVTLRRTASHHWERKARYVSLDFRHQTKAHQCEPEQLAEACSFSDTLCDGPQSDPERQVLANEQSVLMAETLKTLRPDQVEILTRFYLKGQSKEQVQAEMGLTETQFRLNKSRAKIMLTAAMNKRMIGPTRPRLMNKIAA